MQQSQTIAAINVNAIAAFNDNYIWVITKENSQQAILVDPGDANVCINYLEQHQLQLAAILLTHRHQDHIGGVEQLISWQKTQPIPQEKLAIYGPSNEYTPCFTQVTELETITITSLALTINVLDLPGHTKGHIGFLIGQHLFCGDTLFSAGCGRLFDGTAEQLFHSLKKLASLPEDTQVYCAHEYTLANSEFALSLDKNNNALQAFHQQTTLLRNANKSTLPSNIKTERQINPFLRCFDNNIKTALETINNTSLATELEVFVALRKYKDSY